MSFRRAHGTARQLGRTTVWETTPVDELPAAPVGGTVDLRAGRDARGRIRSSETARQLARLRHVVPDFVREQVKCAPAFAAFDRRRRELVRRRIAELHGAFGGVSVGVGMILRSWGWATAFGEYLATLAAETGSPEHMDQSTRHLARASVELAKAYELAAREAAARKASQQHGSLLSQLMAGSAPNPTPVPPLPPPAPKESGPPFLPPSAPDSRTPAPPALAPDDSHSPEHPSPTPDTSQGDAPASAPDSPAGTFSESETTGGRLRAQSLSPCQ